MCQFKTRNNIESKYTNMIHIFFCLNHLNNAQNCKQKTNTTLITFSWAACCSVQVIGNPVNNTFLFLFVAFFGEQNFVLAAL